MKYSKSLHIRTYFLDDQADGSLRSRGYRIQQKRIHESVRRVDPDGVLLRSLEIHVIRRRAYDVVRPLALLHIDGYHKLIRFANLNYMFLCSQHGC